MKYYITVDGGTTNTRLYLVRDGVILDTEKLSIGSGSRKGEQEALRIAVKDAVSALLFRNSLTEGDVERILASGMITSEFGLYELPHLTLPTGIGELHNGKKETVLPDVSPIPFVFLPGVKTAGADIATLDVMRGEETELYGLTDTPEADAVYVLPGSHCKLVYTDESSRIRDFQTTLTGEMIAALSGNTILKDAVDLSTEAVDSEGLFAGYALCAEKGINQALFKVRVLKNKLGRSKEYVYGFFMGVILQAEVENICAANAKKVIIGGKKQIREALRLLLEKHCRAEILSLDDNTVNAATVRGAVKIYEA